MYPKPLFEERNFQNCWNKLHGMLGSILGVNFLSTGPFYTHGWLSLGFVNLIRYIGWVGGLVVLVVFNKLRIGGISGGLLCLVDIGGIRLGLVVLGVLLCLARIEQIRLGLGCLVVF